MDKNDHKIGALQPRALMACKLLNITQEHEVFWIF